MASITSNPRPGLLAPGQGGQGQAHRQPARATAGEIPLLWVFAELGGEFIHIVVAGLPRCDLLSCWREGFPSANLFLATTLDYNTRAALGGGRW